MRYFKKLTGERIYLSPICTDDEELFTKWINDPSVSDNLGNTSVLFTLKKEKKFLEEISENGYAFSIVKQEGDVLLGSVSIFDINQISRSAQCGLFIGEEIERGQGYGGESMRLLIDYGFKALNLQNIMLRVFSFNERAIKCYEKIGFKRIGVRRGCYFLNGQYYDEIYMDILPGEVLLK